MKSEQELLWLVDTQILKPSDLRDLFKGKKLVDAGAVVLSVLTSLVTLAVIIGVF
jgi:hypothetical protein